MLPDLTEHSTSEYEHCAQKLNGRHRFMEEEGREAECRDRIDVTDQCGGLSGYLLPCHDDASADAQKADCHDDACDELSSRYFLVKQECPACFLLPIFTRKSCISGLPCVFKYMQPKPV